MSRVADPQLLAYRNTLQTVAQMRKAQMALTRNPKDQAIALDVKRLEAAVDTRLGTFDIRPEGQ